MFLYLSMVVAAHNSRRESRIRGVLMGFIAISMVRLDLCMLCISQCMQCIDISNMAARLAGR